MSDPIYQDIILEHYRNPQNTGRLSAPESSVAVSNPLCGDSITVDLRMDKGRISEIKYEALGCAISVASMSLLSEDLRGKTKQEVAKLKKEYVLTLLGISLSPNRLKCALLSLEAVQKAVKNI